ncbi:putative F-box domain-containing protein [Medicago truncatula]|uniref:Putative F-box domain-containing protein n=1 Tax=Medicago truncatula TaxID=3880 RepID=A0A396GXU7_MEDTR|nr:F-box/kelch-repeat protein At3g23880-like [Medicago truncatula]RHN45288.1 putative F-box domain-containing protein [Medicago truncatula]
MGTQPPMIRRRHRRSNQPHSVILPEDLNGEILSWLPVKPLMKMKCVSKSWNTLISDPKFVKLHLTRSARSSYSYLVSYEKSKHDGDYSFVPFSITDLFKNGTVTLPKDPYYRLINKDCRRVVGSCNGLVCLLGYDDDQRKETWLRLWNPATRTISDKFGYFRDDMHGLKYWKFEFGYNNSTDTYKVVALNRGSNMTTEVQVLSFGNNIWRKIQSFLAMLLQSYCYDHTKMYTGVHLNCTINWLAVVGNNNLDARFAIISLDLGTETHTQFSPPIDLPGAVSVKVSSVLPGVCALMDSLCFYHEFERTGFVIWKMTKFGDENSWTQFLKFSYDNLQMNFECGHFNIYENGDTMVFVHSQQDRAILYNWRNNRVVKTRVNKKICWFSINNYVESLVSTCCE